MMGVRVFVGKLPLYDFVWVGILVFDVSCDVRALLKEEEAGWSTQTF